MLPHRPKRLVPVLPAAPSASRGMRRNRRLDSLRKVIREMDLQGSTIPPAMILCGAVGTRLRDLTERLPKPMVPMGKFPIVWHIMKSYASFGVTRFYLCLGYEKERFVDYFPNHKAYSSDITIKLGEQNDVTFHRDHDQEDWEVTLVDTGEDTMTGARVALASRYLKDDDEDLFLTYGDGVSDVNLFELLRHHHRHSRAATTTAVHPPGRFGELTLDGDNVKKFRKSLRSSPLGSTADSWCCAADFLTIT